MPRKPTLKDIANRLGISSHTISRALRGLPGMSEAVRQKIIQTAKKRGYQTREQKSSLAMERIAAYPAYSYRFGLVMSLEKRNHSSVNRTLMTAIRDRLLEFNHQLEILIAPVAPTKESFQKWVEEHQVEYLDGLFINPDVGEDTEILLLQLSIPRILISYSIPSVEVDTIMWDVYTPTYHAVQYLYELGHSRVMYIGDISRAKGLRIRWNGFCNAMHEFGLDVDEHIQLLNPRSTSSKKDKHEIKKILSFSPTAFIASGSVPWFYDICNILGKKIPDDFSVIGTQLIQQPFLSNLTRHEFPVYEVGERAAERMLWRLANPHVPYEHIRVRSSFVEGYSTKKMIQVKRA